MPDGTVILVPGITASELFHESKLTGDEVLWLNPVALLQGALAKLRLAGPGESPGSFNEAFIGEGFPLPAYYGLLTRELEARQWRVVAPPADWRRPQTHDTTALVALIRAAAPLGPVYVVCHSRGGLLTRRALGVLAAAGQLSMVRAVVGLGVPHLGSFAAVDYLTGNSPFVQQLLGLYKYAPWKVVEYLGVGAIRLILRSWPSLYELLPHPTRYPIFPQRAAKLYDAATWARVDPVPYQPYIDAAAENWPTVPDVPDAVRWTDVAGYRLDTPDRILDADHIENASAIYRGGEGDGTVPLLSASQSPRKRILTPTAHDMLPQDGRLFEWIHRALLAPLPNSIVIDGPVLRSDG